MNSATATALKVIALHSLVHGFTLACVVLASTAPDSTVQAINGDQGVTKARIYVDPDIRVTYDGDVVHMEAYVTASVTNPDLLFAGGELIVPGRSRSATEARLYRSNDAGASWTFILLPNEVNGGWDNAIAGAVGDTAYFLTSNMDKGLTVYSTSDGGKTWTSAVLKGTDGWDRPQIAVDATNGMYGGRLYVAAEASDGVRVMYSVDAGRTFRPPVTACPHPDAWNAATEPSPLVLSDGTLVVPCAPYPNYPQRAAWSAGEVGIVTSFDGGQTFKPFNKVGVVHHQLDQNMYAARFRGDVLMSGNFMQGPSFAVAPPGAPFADRIYAAWQDIISASCSRLVLSWSADHGSTWSTPIDVDSLGSTCDGVAARQGVPMLGVNLEGVVGVAWFDGRSAVEHKGYDVYFTASLDGGNTFLPPVRVSSATSMPIAGLNITPAADISESSRQGEAVLSMTSPFSQRATGGDNSSMAVDALGRFHPFWADAREGAWQLYTATVRVLNDREMEALTMAASSRAKTASEDCRSDGTRIRLIPGMTKWNGVTNEAFVPVRLVNDSSTLITNPIVVRVFPLPAKEQVRTILGDASVLSPKIFDPGQAAFSDRAVFEYPASSSSPLFPNGVSVPQLWRFRIPHAEFADFSLKSEIAASGCVPK